MKANVATHSVVVGLLLVFTVTLQGCVPWDSRGKKPPPPWEDGEGYVREDKAQKKRAKAEAMKRAKAKAEAEAEEEEKAMPCPKKKDKKGCIPECTWECEAQKCHKQCSPKCLPPVCSTRCTNFNMDGCKMQCNQPSCSVVCPKDYCPRKECPQCETRCGEPVCTMKCPEAPQQCRHVCAKPACKWECKDPKECPRPKCQLKCQREKTCTGTQMQMFDGSLPPLKPGETEVLDSTFSGSLKPAWSLMQAFTSGGGGSTMRVNITSMGQDHLLKSHQVEVSLASEDADAAATSHSAFLQQRSQGGLHKCKESDEMFDTEDSPYMQSDSLQVHLRP